MNKIAHNSSFLQFKIFSSLKHRHYHRAKPTLKSDKSMDTPQQYSDQGHQTDQIISTIALNPLTSADAASACKKEPNLIVHDNTIALSGCEKLYLNAQTADVFFTFHDVDSDEVKIPAHRGILAKTSPIFDERFFSGAGHVQNNFIPIKNVKPQAFREFLQFFYLRTVTLSTENKTDVFKLCEKYKLDKCTIMLEQANIGMFKGSLNTDNMCHGYELAILFNHYEVKKYCKQQISEHAHKIFKSSSFLKCQSDVLRKILQLNVLACNEIDVLDACLEWAKSNCIAQGLDENFAVNLRSQLGDIIYEIRFGEIPISEFYARYQTHKDLFTSDEFMEIIGLIASKTFQPTKFNRIPRAVYTKVPDILVCDRIDPIGSTYFQSYTIYEFDYTVFSSNRRIWLKSFEFCEVFNEKSQSIPVRMRIIPLDCSDRIMYLRQMALSPNETKVVDLPTPIEITPTVKYAIVCEIRTSGCYNLLLHKPNVEVCHGIFINFHDFKHGSTIIKCKQIGIVTKLTFSTNES